MRGARRPRPRRSIATRARDDAGRRTARDENRRRRRAMGIPGARATREGKRAREGRGRERNRDADVARGRAGRRHGKNERVVIEKRVRAQIARELQPTAEVGGDDAALPRGTCRERTAQRRPVGIVTFGAARADRPCRRFLQKAQVGRCVVTLPACNRLTDCTRIPAHALGFHTVLRQRGGTYRACARSPRRKPRLHAFAFLREYLQSGLGSGVVGTRRGVGGARFGHAKRVWRTQKTQIAQV